MKRNKFILSAISIASIPIISLAKNNHMKTGSEKGFKVPAGEGRLHGHIKLKGVNSNILDLKISGSDTDGGFSMFEQTSVSQGRGTPFHVHHTQNEMFHVLEGSYFFKVGEDKFHLNAGDSIFLPMKVPHAWTQVSEKGKMTVLFQPAGKMEAFFLAMSSLEKEPTQAEIAKLFADSEMQIVGPPLNIEQ